MARYLNREQVVASFKLEYIPHIKDKPLSVKKQAWDILLGSLYDDGKISKHQKDTWVYPSEVQ
jgi:hypothetical protein